MSDYAGDTDACTRLSRAVLLALPRILKSAHRAPTG